MNSYFLYNRDAREVYLGRVKEGDFHPVRDLGTAYPSNVTARNFFQYMMAPTLTYQETYARLPIVRNKAWLLSLMGRFALIWMGLVSQSSLLEHAHNLL